MGKSSAALVRDRGAAASFTSIKALTGLYAIAAAATLVFVALTRGDRRVVNSAVWTHAVIVFVFSVPLVGVAHQAARGARRALVRLQITSIVIPIVSVVLLIIPRLPSWMKVEQGLYALMLTAVALLATRVRMHSSSSQRVS